MSHRSMHPRMVYGRWTVLEPYTSKLNALCQCSCGNTAEVGRCNLRSGASTQCKDCANAAIGDKLISHGQTRNHDVTPEMRAFRAAKRRCIDPNIIGFKDYGGRGIEFHFSSFEEFFAALGSRPHGTTIERINNDGHYEVGNVRWATRKEQRANRRRQRYTEEGKRKLSIAHTGRRNTPETLDKMRLSAIARWARERVA